jgi:hypothetical protein
LSALVLFGTHVPCANASPVSWSATAGAAKANAQTASEAMAGNFTFDKRFIVIAPL